MSPLYEERIPTPVTRSLAWECQRFALLGRMWASAPAMQNKDGAKRDVVPQGHLFRCAPRQDAVPYGRFIAPAL